MATSSSDMTVKIWNTDWLQVRTYTNHTDVVYALTYVDSDIIISGAFDQTIRIWSISTGLTNRTINTGSKVKSLEIMSNGYLLACGFYSPYNVNIYNINTGELISSLIGHTGTPNDFQWISSDVLASSSYDKSIRIWNLTTNSTKFYLTGHNSSVYGLKLIFSDVIASASSDNTLKLWNISSGSLLRTLLAHANYIYFSVDMLSDEQTLVSGSMDQTIKLWNVNTGQVLDTITTGLSIRSMAVLNPTSIFKQIRLFLAIFQLSLRECLRKALHLITLYKLLLDFLKRFYDEYNHH